MWLVLLIVISSILIILTLDKLDKLRDIVDVFFVSRLLEIVFGLPKIDLQRFSVETKAVTLVKHLDTLLSLLYLLVQHVSNLIVDEGFSVVTLLLEIFQFN